MTVAALGSPANPAQAPSASEGATVTSPIFNEMSRRGQPYR